MNDLRTKVTDLPLLEDKEQVDTVLALGKDGKMYRIDGSNIGGGSKLTPIKCQYVNHDGYCELRIKDTESINNLLETGGAIHVFVIQRNFSYKDIELNFVTLKTPSGPPQGTSPQSLSALSYKPVNVNLIYGRTLIGISLTQIDLDYILVLELHDNNIQDVADESLDDSYRYSLKLYMIKISDIQGALEELSKENVNDDSEYLQNYDSPNDIVYGHFITYNVYFYMILNVFMEDKSVLSQPCLVEISEQSPQ